MPAAQESPALRKVASAHSQPRDPSAVASDAQTPPTHGAAVWAVLAVFWLLALASVAADALNFRQIIAAGQRVESQARQALHAQPGSPPDPVEPLARQAPPLLLDPDSYCWIIVAQQGIKDGTLRPRTVSFDNAPAGRELHWSSSFQWWLRLLGATTRGFTGLTAAQAIAAVAPWANPVLFALFLTALLLVAHQRAGAWTAGALVLTLATIRSVDWDFGYARPDHHGLHQMAFLGMLLSLLAAGLGWVRGAATASKAEGGLEPQATGRGARATTRNTEGGRNVATDTGGTISADSSLLSEGQAWRWFACSGVCAGIGLWIGATQQMMLIGATGLGAGLGILFFARPVASAEGTDTRFAPELWRHWGRAAAATSFALYLLEYFPSHLTMRLEANHPLYALAMLGGGELLCAVGRWRTEGADRQQIFRGILLGALGLSLLPAAVLIGSHRWYIISDPFMVRLLRCTTEGRPLVEPWSAWAFTQALWQSFGALPLALPLGAGLLCWPRQTAMPPHRRAALLTVGAAAVVCLGWNLVQSRWLGLAGASLAVLAVVVVPTAWDWKRQGGAVSWLALLLALAAPGWAAFWALQATTYGEPPERHLRATILEPLAHQELAWSIRLAANAAGIPTPRVMAPVEAAPALHQFGGADSIGSIYWENIVGCHAMADFYGDAGEADARRIARERGLDFVAVIARPGFVRQIQFLKNGNTQTEGARQTLAFRLANPVRAQPPNWLEPMPLSNAPVAGRDYRLYRVLRDRL